MFDTNPTFNYEEAVEAEENILLKDSYGVTVIDADEQPIQIWKSESGDNYYTENDQKIPVALADESSSLKFHEDGKPLVVFATLTSCPIRTNSSDEQIFATLTNENGEIYIDSNGDDINIRLAISECNVAYDNDEPSYEKETIIKNVEREIQCDLSSLEVEITQRWLLDYWENNSAMLRVFVPDEVLNSDCETSYKESIVLLSDNNTYDVTEQIEEIIGQTAWSVSLNVLPANLDGLNESNFPLFNVRRNTAGILSAATWEIIIDNYEKSVSFQQLGPSGLNIGIEDQFAYNGEYLLVSKDRSNNELDNEFYLVKRGETGFKIIQPTLDSNGVSISDGGTGICYKNCSFQKNGTISLGNGNFLIYGNGSSKPYALVFNPQTEEIVERYGNYSDINKKYKDYYSCETSEPDATFVPADQINDRDQFVCKEVRDVRLISAQLQNGNSLIKGRYKNWFLSGISEDLERQNFAWSAWDSEAKESTGIIGCAPHTKPLGAESKGTSCPEPRYSAYYRNYIIAISGNGRQFTKYNMDDKTEVHIDITNQGLFTSEIFEVFKDLIMVDVTQSNTGDRVWLEINFEDNAAYERGVIEDGGLKVVKFVQ
ncbi:MAG: hypothetical protein VW522_11200 [Candidatus Neomarinimicrobiota bacterium]